MRSERREHAFQISTYCFLSRSAAGGEAGRRAGDRRKPAVRIWDFGSMRIQHTRGATLQL
jgi:hypothetical protein